MREDNQPSHTPAAGDDRPRSHRDAAGRVLGFLFVFSGFATLASPLLPKAPGFHSAGVVAVGVVAVLAGLVGLRLPWRRWPLGATLVAVPPAFLLISIHNIAGGDDPYRFGIFYLVAFTWIGMFHARGTSAKFAVLLVPSYLAPLLVRGEPASAVASIVYAAPIYVMVGETIAWQGTRLRALQDRLLQQALHDALTGLPNRRALLSTIGRSLARAERTEQSVGLLYLDLDGFKGVNDRRGHAAGDALLVGVADALRAIFRATDTPSRLAGDEFAVLVDGPVTEAALAQLRGRVRDAIRALATTTDVPLGVSIGYAVSAGGEAPEEFLRRADLEMYLEKRSARVHR